jgi:DNA-binding NarL/FixJ family response regulator
MTTRRVRGATLAAMPTRIVVGEADYLAREGLVRALDGAGDMRVVANCADLTSLRRSVRAEQPDAVVMALAFPPGSADEGLLFGDELRHSQPDVALVVLGERQDSERALSLFEDGATKRAYLLRDDLQCDLLVTVVREVVEGRALVDAATIGRLLHARTGARHPRVATLTAREQDVLRLVAQAASNTAISVRLGITTRAVERHINSIFRKLQLSESDQVNRRVKAALLFGSPDY